MKNNNFEIVIIGTLLAIVSVILPCVAFGLAYTDRQAETDTLKAYVADNELTYEFEKNSLCAVANQAANEIINTNDMSYPINYDDWSYEIEILVKANVCKRLLDVCAQDGILDANGVRAYHNNMCSINQYKELISECMAEDNFWDTIGETDEWCLYEYYIMSENNK